MRLAFPGAKSSCARMFCGHLRIARCEGASAFQRSMRPGIAVSDVPDGAGLACLGFACMVNGRCRSLAHYCAACTEASLAVSQSACSCCEMKRAHLLGCCQSSSPRQRRPSGETTGVGPAAKVPFGGDGLMTCISQRESCLSLQ